MGHEACVIIINCGALKSKAAELQGYPFAILKEVAAEMFSFESELCDNAVILTEALTPPDKLLVTQQGEKGWAFAKVMQSFMDTHLSALTFDKKEFPDTSAVADFELKMRSFLDTQMQFFHDLVARYANA